MVVVNVGDLVSTLSIWSLRNERMVNLCISFLESLVKKPHFLRRVNYFVQTICSKYIMAKRNIVGSLFPILWMMHKNICLLHKVW